MSNRITVTSAELHDTSGQMAAAGAQISAELQRILRQVADLTSSWTGQASASFNSLYTDFNSNWSRCEDSLRQIGSMLDNAAAAYDDTEANLASSFR